MTLRMMATPPNVTTQRAALSRRLTRRNVVLLSSSIRIPRRRHDGKASSQCRESSGLQQAPPSLWEQKGNNFDGLRLSPPP